VAKNPISEAFRNQYLVDSSIEFLNAGTLSPTLKCALDATHEAMLQWVRSGPGAALEVPEANAYLDMMKEQDHARRAVADWMGTEPHHIALVGNVTDGINAALQSIEWAPGDHLVTTDEEHQAASSPIAEIARRHGVVIDTVTFPKDESEAQRHRFLQDLRQAIGSRTKLVELSQVGCKTAVSLAIDDLVSPLLDYPDVWLLVDGAHAAGTQIALLHPRVDFYTYPGHKWMMGPIGTGVLYVSDRALEHTRSTLSGAAMMSAEGESYENNPHGAWRYEYGTRDWTKLVGLATAIRFRRQWSETDIVAHYRANNAAFRIGFEAACDERMMCGKSALVTFTSTRAAEVIAWLWESQRVLARTVTDERIRISLGAWLDSARAQEIGQIFGRAVSRLEQAHR